MTVLGLDPEWLRDDARERAAALAINPHHAPYWVEGGRAVGYFVELPGVFWRSRRFESPQDAARRVLRDHYRVPAEVTPRVDVLLITPPEPTP